MRIRITALAEGPGPFETIVGIRTADGAQEEVVLSKRLVEGNGIDIGTPLLHEVDRFLVELPRESAAGRWRIWIPASEAIPAGPMQAAG